VKGQESLCAKMTRTKIKGTGIRKGVISSTQQETAPQPPHKIVVSLFSSVPAPDNREDTAATSCAGEKNAAEDEGLNMEAIFPMMGNNRDQKEQEGECWMGSSISSIFEEDNEEDVQQAERLVSKRRRSSRCSIFFDVCDEGMGQDQDEQQFKRRRSSMCSIIVHGDDISSSFGGRSFYVVDDYNPPPQSASSRAAHSLVQPQQTNVSFMKAASSSTAASGMNTSWENDRKHLQGLLGTKSLVSMVSPPGANNLTRQEAELTNDMVSTLRLAEHLFSHPSPRLLYPRCKKEQTE
jgi:hypothetical protein